MKIDLPNVKCSLEIISNVESVFMGKRQEIGRWVQENRKDIKRNLKLVRISNEENDIEILLSFLRDLLVRAMPGEAGESTYKELKAVIKAKSDLKKPIYRKALKKSRYRWSVEGGADIISDVVRYFDKTLNWDWGPRGRILGFKVLIYYDHRHRGPSSDYVQLRSSSCFSAIP